MANVGIIVDHPKRDLAGAVLMAHELASRGHRACLVPLYEQAVDVPLLQLDALIVNYARPANRDLVEGYADMGIAAFVLDTEGGNMTARGANAPEVLARYVNQSGYRELLSGYLFWGGRLREAFVGGSGMPAQALHVTGCPRFDYCSPRLRGMLTFPRRDFVLINANFAAINPLFARSPEQERKTMIASGWPEDYVDQLLADMRGILAGFLRDLGRLARMNPQREFLMRPHPFEDPRIYREAFAGLKNVAVSGEGNVLNVIHNASCLLHVNCATAIEAVMLDKLPISLEYLNTPHMAEHGSLPSQISYHARSFEHLQQCVDNLPALSRDFDFEGVHERLVFPWFHATDGNAATRVADIVGGVPGTKWSRRARVAHSLRASRRQPRRAQRMQAAAGNVIGSFLVSELRGLAATTRREKRLSRQAVAGLFRALASPMQVRRASHPVTRAPLASLEVIGEHA